MGQRTTGRFFGALALLAVFLPLTTAAGCKLFSKEKKAYGEDCASDEECESVECAQYGSVCTKSCTFDKECGAGFVCRAHDQPRPGQSCAKPVGVPTGQACNNAAECQSGNCLKPVGQQDSAGFCSTYCDTDADCPENYKLCLSISDSGQLKFCLPGGGSAAIPGTTEPPKFVAPRPIATTTKTATTTTTTTTTPAPTTTSTTTTTTSSTTTTTTTTSSTTGTRPPTPTATPTSTTTVKRPPGIFKPKK